MEEKENKTYLTMAEVKDAVYNDTRDLNFSYIASINILDLIYNLAMRISVFLTVYSGLNFIFYLIYKSAGTKFSIHLFPAMAAITILIFLWNSNCKKMLEIELEQAKLHMAAIYFSKTKEYEQEEWIRNKIFENEIMPLIS